MGVPTGDYYQFPFTQAVAGHEPPTAGYDPTKRVKLKLIAGYTMQDLIDDIPRLCEENGLEVTVRGLYRGTDLEIRPLKRPKVSNRKLSDADKVALLSAVSTQDNPVIRTAQDEVGYEVASLAIWFDDHVDYIQKAAEAKHAEKQEASAPTTA